MTPVLVEVVRSINNVMVNNDPTNSNFAIIGSGNVAYFLAHHLTKVGLKLRQIHSRNSKTGNELAQLSGAKFEEDIAAVNAELIFIAVQDDQIEFVLPLLPKSSKMLISSGSFSLPESSVHQWGIFYPLQTFSKSNYNADFDGPILIETQNEALRYFCVKLCLSFHFSYHYTTAQDRKNIHLCAVFLNNFVNHVACLGITEAKERSIDPTLFTSLITKTFENILTFDSCQHQSGPAKRNDKKIINEQLSLLKGNAKTVYHLLSESISAKHEK